MRPVTSSSERRSGTGCWWLRTSSSPSRFELSVPARPRAGNAMTTKKKAKPRRVREPNPELDALRPKYDFSAGVRGKYAGRYPHGSIVVTLDPDVAAVYPSAEAAND